MTTNHAQFLRKATQDFIGEAPGNGVLLVNHMKAINRELFPVQWHDAVFQRGVGHQADMFDAFVFIRLECLLLTGQLAYLPIELPGIPCRDSDDDGNNAILSEIPHPFSATFCGGDKMGSDGHVSWSEPVEFFWSPKGPGHEFEKIAVRPGFMELEVGTTESSKTFEHLIYKSQPEGCSVARWPYGHTTMTIIRRISEAEQIAARGHAVKRPRRGSGRTKVGSQ